jgi:uncharacterized surface protein with fasciclin (FAS1) repeats
VQVPNVEQIAAASGYAIGVSQLNTVPDITALMRGSNATTLLVIDNSSSNGGAYYPQQEACSATADRQYAHSINTGSSSTDSNVSGTDAQYEQLLRYHVLQGAQTLTTAGEYSTAATAVGNTAAAVVHVQWACENVGHPFAPAVTGLYVNAAEVAQLQPIQALNGVIWRLTQPLTVPTMTLLQLLLPPTITNATTSAKSRSSSSSADTTATTWGQWMNSDSELSAMLNNTAAGPFTVFAPSGNHCIIATLHYYSSTQCEQLL